MILVVVSCDDARRRRIQPPEIDHIEERAMKETGELYAVRWRSLSRLAVWRQQASIRLHQYGYPLLSLVRREFKTRYGLTALGPSWAIVHPLMFLLLYTLVFPVIMRVRFRPDMSAFDSALYLVCGLLPYLAMVESMHRACTSLTENRSLLEKVVFPAEVLPAVPVVTSAVTEIIGLVLIAALAGFRGLSAWIVFLPLLVILRILFTLGLAWFVSVLNVFLRDLGQVLGLILTAWMFLTPIFYPLDLIPESLTWLLRFNFLYQLVSAYRAVVMAGRSPANELPYLFVWTGIVLALGLWFFQRTLGRAKDFL
jgi:homopolymeric O-antigen transport system permease protein